MENAFFARVILNKRIGARIVPRKQFRDQYNGTTDKNANGLLYAFKNALGS